MNQPPKDTEVRSKCAFDCKEHKECQSGNCLCTKPVDSFEVSKCCGAESANYPMKAWGSMCSSCGKPFEPLTPPSSSKEEKCCQFCFQGGDYEVRNCKECECHKPSEFTVPNIEVNSSEDKDREEEKICCGQKMYWATHMKKILYWWCEKCNKQIRPKESSLPPTWEEEALEALASIEHDQWVEWSTALADSERGISSEHRERWAKLWVPYSKLTEEQKEHDRSYARIILSRIALRVQEARKEAKDELNESMSEYIKGIEKDARQEERNRIIAALAIIKRHTASITWGKTTEDEFVIRDKDLNDIINNLDRDE